MRWRRGRKRRVLRSRWNKSSGGVAKLLQYRDASVHRRGRIRSGDNIASVTDWRAGLRSVE